MAIKPEDRLIFALDTFSAEEAERYVECLEGAVKFFKVGIILHTLTGAEFVSGLIKRGKRVFLDLKYLDIADTVRDAVRQVSAIGAEFLTVHANRSVMKAAAEGRGTGGPKILAVTLLTDLDSEEHGGRSPEEIVLSRARAALECGCDGVITSGREAAAVKRETGGRLLVVTPGVRQAGASTHGHKRFVTPSDAIMAGADYIVAGRPIKNADDPRAAALAMLSEMGEAFRKRTEGGNPT